MGPGRRGPVSAVSRSQRPFLFDELRKAGYMIRSNLGLRLAWPLVLRLVRRPWIVVDHVAIRPALPGPRRQRNYLKTLTLPAVIPTLFRRLCIQQVLICRAGEMRIPNPYDDDVLRTPGAGARPGKTVYFVATLDPMRGAGMCFCERSRTTSIDRGRSHSLTVVGDGPEMQSSRDLAHKLQIDAVMHGFCGALGGRSCWPTPCGNIVNDSAVRAETLEAWGIRLPWKVLASG